MTKENNNVEFVIIQKKLTKYSRVIEDIVRSVKDDVDKKDSLILLSRELNDLLCDIKNIYYKAKKRKLEDEFENAKNLLIGCVEVQNMAYGHIVNFIAENDPMLAFRYDGVIRANQDYARRISDEKLTKGLGLFY